MATFDSTGMIKNILKYLLAAFLLLTFSSGTVIAVLSGTVKESKGLYSPCDSSENDPVKPQPVDERESAYYIIEQPGFLLSHFLFSLRSEKYSHAHPDYAQTYFSPVLTPPPDTI